MRSVLLATTLVAFPLAAFAQSRCAIPAPDAMVSEPTIQLPSPVTVGGPPVPLMPSVPAGAISVQAPPALPLASAATESGRPQAASGRQTSTTMALDDIKSVPALAHIAAAGATLSDLGTSHGLHAIYARNGGQVMVFQVTPDREATVAGLMTDLSVDQLKTIGGADVTELSPLHGLRALFLHNGQHFQVFYASPDGERVIPGVMWDAAGKDLTRDQVASIPGTVPTVAIGSDKPGGATAASVTSPEAGGSLVVIAEGTTHGSIGDASAPELWMFFDPQCSFSVRAMQQLAPAVAAGKLRLNVVPLSILDGEDNGLSTRSALNLVSTPADQMVTAWETGHSAGAPVPDAGAKLQANMAAAAAIHLQGTPTFVWRKTAGTEGRLDGIPNDMNALLAAVGS